MIIEAHGTQHHGWLWRCMAWVVETPGLTVLSLFLGIIWNLSSDRRPLDDSFASHASIAASPAPSLHKDSCLGAFRESITTDPGNRSPSVHFRIRVYVFTRHLNTKSRPRALSPVCHVHAIHLQAAAITVLDAPLNVLVTSWPPWSLPDYTNVEPPSHSTVTRSLDTTRIPITQIEKNAVPSAILCVPGW